jgi:glycosyltransferase involved in cell wall biosynthesis
VIKVDKVEEGLPISVIIPLSEKRKSFFYNYTLPLIEANEPIEIIINSNNGSASKKRNDGFKKSTQPFIFFCDDDILLPKNIFQLFIDELEKDKNVGYVYCGYDGIVLDIKNHPIKKNFKIKSEKFNEDTLKKYNYISTMSLIRRENFIGFDEGLKRFQDWDLYLSLLKKGIRGKFIENVNFYAFYLDDGLTSNDNSIVEAHNKIKQKHNL